MKKILVLACLVAILFAGKVTAQTGAPGFLTGSPQGERPVKT